MPCFLHVSHIILEVCLKVFSLADTYKSSLENCLFFLLDIVFIGACLSINLFFTINTYYNAGLNGFVKTARRKSSIISNFCFLWLTCKMIAHVGDHIPTTSNIPRIVKKYIVNKSSRRIVDSSWLIYCWSKKVTL